MGTLADAMGRAVRRVGVEQRDKGRRAARGGPGGDLGAGGAARLQRTHQPQRHRGAPHLGHGARARAAAHAAVRRRLARDGAAQP
eukprot:scaffold9768_cov56-Phaeocystis_antarctica.AAC.1